ncbi:MAG: aspartate kinase [Acutalibacteraceae bacterium]
MSLIVQKFGGTSVSDTHHILNVAKKVTDLYSENNKVIVVVSAQGHTTDMLVKKAKEISDIASNREMDMLLSSGEQISVALLSMAIQKLGYPAISLTGYQAGILTDSCYEDARILSIDTTRIQSELNKRNIVVLAGFQGINDKNDITTLGRGGSDTTAVAISAAMGADLCKIYTDVDGVYTSDPRIVQSARKINVISYDDMYALSYCGAQVLNDRSIEIAKKNNVEIEVLSSLSENSKGTLVRNIPKKNTHMVSGVAILNDMVKFILSDIDEMSLSFNDIISKLKENNIWIDTNLMPIGKIDKSKIIFVIKEEHLSYTLKILKNCLKIEDSKIFYEKDKSQISVVNISESFNINIASIIFEVLAESNINYEMVACTEKRVSVIIPSFSGYQALNMIHSKIFEEDSLV